MRLRKDGTPASLDPDVWHVAAGTHDETAAALSWLANRSFATLLGDVDEDADIPKGAETIARIRAKCEARVLDLLAAGTPRRPEDLEIESVLSSLLMWSIKEREEAELCRSIARSTKPGRPRALHQTNALVGLLRSAGTKKGNPGRRLAVPITDNDLLRALDAGRASGDKTDVATLRRIAIDHLRASGQHSAGDRLRRLTANLQKRVASARAKIRK